MKKLKKIEGKENNQLKIISYKKKNKINIPVGMYNSSREIKDKTINDYEDNSTKTPMRTEGEKTLKANRSSGKNILILCQMTQKSVSGRRGERVSA